jgi:hypothetical protein
MLTPHPMARDAWARRRNGRDWRRTVAIVALTLANAGIASAQSPEWRFGVHPLWGPSAFITIGAESVGLRCLDARDIDQPVAALVITKGLGKAAPASGRVQSEGLVSYKFLGAKDWGSGLFASKGAYLEMAGSTCEVHVDAFGKARELVFVDASSDDEIDKIPATRLKVILRVPLAGSKAAIAKLIAACPMMRKDIDNACGI